jgi:pleckstrin family protein A (phosphoinositide binding specific) protein 8
LFQSFTVSQADPLRLDVTVPGEQHFYLRASTSQERQQWLVALGSAKACEGLTTKDTYSEPGEYFENQ